MIEIPESAYQEHLDKILRFTIKFDKIKKIAKKQHDERYVTDWDDMQKALEKIWRLTK